MIKDRGIVEISKKVDPAYLTFNRTIIKFCSEYFVWSGTVTAVFFS